MISLHFCPRCSGAVSKHQPSDTEGELFCINCGWRSQEIPNDVSDEVKDHLGKSLMANGNSKRQFGTGKPPASGWDRVKSKRERVRRRLAGREQKMRSRNA